MDFSRQSTSLKPRPIRVAMRAPARAQAHLHWRAPECACTCTGVHLHWRAPALGSGNGRHVELALAQRRERRPQLAQMYDAVRVVCTLDIQPCMVAAVLVLRHLDPTHVRVAHAKRGKTLKHLPRPRGQAKIYVKHGGSCRAPQRRPPVPTCVPEALTRVPEALTRVPEALTRVPEALTRVPEAVPSPPCASAGPRAHAAHRSHSATVILVVASVVHTCRTCGPLARRAQVQVSFCATGVFFFVSNG